MEFAEKLTFEDFEKMHSLENKFYDEEFITPAKEAYEWYVSNQDKVNKKPYFEFIDEHFN